MTPDKDFVEHINNKRQPSLLATILVAIVVVTVAIACPNLYWIYAIKSGSDSFEALKIDEATNYFNQAVWASRFFPKADERLAVSLNILSTVLIAKGDYDEALTTINESISISKKLYGSSTNPKLVKPLLMKAGLNRRQGNYSKAVQIYKQVLKLFAEDKYKSNVYRDTLKALSILEIYRGNYDDAQKGLKEVNTLNKKLGQNTILNVSEVAYNLGRVEEAKGNYKSAHVLYDKAIKILAPAITDYNSTHALILNLKAELFLHENRIKDAEPLVSKAYSLSQNLSAEEYLQAANLKSIINLTTIYLNTHNIDKAKKIIETSLPIAEKRLGPGHPAYSKVLSQKGKLLAMEGKFKDAKSLIKRSRSLISKTVGKEHRYVAHQTCNLADLNCSENQLELAKSLYEEALTVFANTISSAHPEYADCQIRYANCLEKLGQIDKANALRAKTGSIFTRANNR